MTAAEHHDGATADEFGWQSFAGHNFRDGWVRELKSANQPATHVSIAKQQQHDDTAREEKPTEVESL